MKKIYLTLLGVFTFALWQIGNAQTILLSEDFASGIPGTWQNIDNSGGGSWTYYTIPGRYGLTFGSSSGSNGYAVFDADTIGNDGLAENADLITQSINCSGQSTVKLYFEEMFVQYAIGQGVVSVSNNGGTTWTDFYTVGPGIPQDNYNGNPNINDIDISSVAANQSNVTIKFNYSGDWDYWWMIDDIMVYAPAAYDAAVVSGFLSEYTAVPFEQATSYTPSCQVYNNGGSTVTGVSVETNIYNNSTNALVYNTTMTQASLATGTSATLTASSAFTPPSVAFYIAEFIVSINETDGDISNDTLYWGINVTDSLYARDDAILFGYQNGVTAVLGVGAGSTFIAGNVYDIQANSTLVSIDAFINASVAPGDTVNAHLYNFSGTAVGSLISSQQKIIAVADTPVIDMSFTFNTPLAPGQYFMSIEEASTVDNIGLWFSDGIYTTNKTQGSFNGGAFSDFETLTGGNYRNVPLVRANIYTTTASCSITDLTAGTQGACNPSNNQYTQQVMVTYSNPPASGSLSVNGQTFAITSSPQTVTLTGLTSNGSAVNVTANFTANTACTYTENSLFTAPAPCNVCSITDLTAGTQGACNPSNNQYTQQVTVTYSNPPASGSLSVNGQTFAITSSPQTVTLTGLTSNGSAVNVTANFTANTACTYTENSLFTAPASCLCPAITVSVSTTNVTNCATPNGTLTTTVSGGASPYSYVWNPVLANQPNHSGLSAGTYSVTVTDANNCPGTGSGTITNATGSLNASISTFQNISCFGANDGTVSVTVTGATGAINYNWSDQGFNSTISTRNNLTPGAKTVTVSDASGCSVTLSFNIVEPSQLTATLVSTTDVLCNGLNTGSVDMTVSGGTGTPTYSWTNTTQNTVDLTGVGAGSYTLTVTDANGCTDTESATINEPSAISVVVDNTSDVSCYMGNDGAIDVTVGGGTPNYTYAWTNGAGTNEDASGLSAGDYTLTVTDANGCTASSTQVTIANATMLDGTTSSTAETSSGAADGTATVVATGGNGTYTYLWSDNAAQTTATATGLSAGTYTVTITDGNGCTNTETVVVDLGNSINSIVMQSLQIFPNPTNKDVTISFSVDQSIETTISIFNTLGKVVYSKSNNVVNNYSTTVDVSTFAAGVYIVEVSNGNGKAVKKLTVSK